MKVCIVGAGAIGGFIGTRLALAGHDVSAFARGATLDALREKRDRPDKRERKLESRRKELVRVPSQNQQPGCREAVVDDGRPVDEVSDEQRGSHDRCAHAARAR